MNLIDKLKGDKQPLPKEYGAKTILFAGVGGIIAIATVALLTNLTQYVLILGSFGATCVLVFGFPDLPFSQPRNTIVGHFISSLTGLLCYHFVSTEWWSLALAVGVSIMLMMFTRTVHPPAGSNPVIVFVLKSSFSFLFFPTLIGAIIIVAIALLFNNLTRESKYPKYW
jgi:CBS-domain-containing membrane protein